MEFWKWEPGYHSIDCLCWWTIYPGYICIWYIIHKFLWRKICKFRNHSDFKSLFPIHIFLSFSIRNFFFDRWQIYVHNLLKPVGCLHQKQWWSKRAPDLAWFSRYSLFGPALFLKFCLHFGSVISEQLQWVWTLEAKCWAVFDCTDEYAEKSQRSSNSRV